MGDTEQKEPTSAASDPAPVRPEPAPRPTSPPPRILCVDDEPAMLKILKRALQGEFEIVTAQDPVQALGLVESGMKFSVIISDMRMPQMDGAEFLARVRRLAPDSTRLALTACLERELPPEEVFGILTKPCPLNLLHASVQAAVEQHALQTLLRSSPRVPVPLPVRIPGYELHSAAPPQVDPALDVAPSRLSLDPWIQTSATRPLTSDPSPARLSMLAAVAEKFFRLGQASEAERILRPALWDFLQRCEGDRPPLEGELELAGRLALRLADGNHSAGWIDYLFRAFTSVSRLLSADVIEALQDLLRRIPGVSHHGFVRYLSALRACRHEFSPADHYLYRRIEGLEALLLL